MTILKTILISLLVPLHMASAADSGQQTLVELLKDDKVSAAYSDCKEKKPPVENIDNCIWEALDDKTKEEVKKKLALAKEGGSEKDNKTQYESLDLTSGIKKTDDKKNKKTEKDPAIQKLENFLAKRLDETLYGDAKKNETNSNEVRVVSHNVFFDLQESQVGKNVISAISSYCINADAQYLYDPNKKAKNIEALKNFQDIKDDKTGASENKNTSYLRWENCAKNIKNICSGQDLASEIDTSTDLYKRSKTQACLVTKNIANARQVLLKLEQIKKANAENAQQPGTVLQGKKQSSVYTGGKEGKDGKNIDDLTSISSSDIAKSGYDEGIKEKKKMLDDCKSAGNAESAECKKIFLTADDAEEEKKELEEYNMRTKVLEAKVSAQDITNEDVTSYLKEQGYDEEKIQAMLKSSVDDVKAKIAERYKAERDAIKEELNKKLKEKTLTTEEVKDKNSIQSKISSLASEVQGRPEELKNLIHYNNVVSGFLSIDTGNKEKNTPEAQNVASIVRELDNSEGLTPEQKQKNEELKKELLAKGVKLGDVSDAKSASLSVQTINESLLNYTEKNEEKEGKKP